MATILVRHRAPNDFLILELPVGMSIRPLETALQRRNVATTIDRNRRIVYLHLSAAHILRSLRDDFPFEVHDSALSLMSSSTAPSVTLEEQKAIVESYHDLGRAKDAVKDVPFIEALDDHQLSAVAAATDKAVDGLCIFDEQGLGKTIQALFAFHVLRQRGLIDIGLVLCPKNMVMEWAHDCTRMFGHDYSVVTVSGSLTEKRKMLAQRADLYVTNFETAVSITHTLQEILKRPLNGSLLIVDESFYVKNRDSRRARAMLNLRAYVRRCLVLCGTPAPNHPTDIVAQMDLASSGRTFSGVSIPKDRNAAAQVISEVLDRRGVYVRRLKKVVMPSLPDKTLNRVLVRLSDAQAELYQSSLLDLQSSVCNASQQDFQTNRLSYFAKRSALLQICVCPAAVAPGFKGEVAKHAALDQILHELIDRQREKVVLWSFYLHSIEKLVQRYARYCPVRIDGTIPDIVERRESIRRFQDDNETMLIIANPAAAGAGITLHRARIAIYESMSNQTAHYLQSLDRVHRRGQTRPVEYLILLSEGTLEVTEFENLQRKEQDSRELLGDPSSTEITRDLFLDELNQAVEAFKCYRN